jgi:hypothetical protein
MHTNLDRRLVTIQELEQEAEGDSLKSLTLLNIPVPGGSVDLDDVTKRITTEIKTIFQNEGLTGIDGYEITDTRRVIERGAGDSFQEIVLAVVSGSAEGVTTVASTVLITKLISWLTKKYGTQVPPPSLDEEIDWVKRIISTNFVPRGPLEAIEASHSRIVFKDNAGNLYEAEMLDGLPNSIQIKKRQNVIDH